MQDHERPLTISIPEAGKKYFGIEADASYRAANNGDIPYIKVGGRKRVPVAALDAMLASVARKPAAA
jgi:hypothetical protein